MIFATYQYTGDQLIIQKELNEFEELLQRRMIFNISN